MAEIPFEALLMAIEGTRGTPEAAPTRYLNLAGTITPRKERYRPDESRGTLAEYYRSVDARKWCDWEGTGPLDVYTLLTILNTLVAGGIDGTGAVAATLSTNLTGTNNDIDFTAVTAGGVGNTISVEYIDPLGNNQVLGVNVDGRAIDVYLATGAGGAITTTGDLLKAAILAHPVASTLVTCADKAGNDGSEVVTAMAATHLAGGTGADVTTPGGGTDSRLWTFAPTMTSDDLEALTLWFGDPNVQVFRAGYCMPDELTISGDASGTDGVTMSVNGQGLFPAKVADPVVPAMLSAPMLMPTAMQLWIDTATIGSTPVAGRLISAEVTLPSGISRKWLAAGPTSDLSFSKIGRGKRHAELALRFEVDDMTQYDQWVAATSLMTRVRFNGSLIEGALYYYVDFDIYGPFDGMEWGENEGTNRTLDVTILSEYNAVAGYDWCVRVQNNRDAL
jgi:hypothetical protein